MRIDLFAVWFMNGLLGQPPEQSAVFAMASCAKPSVPELPCVAVSAASGYLAKANSL